MVLKRTDSRNVMQKRFKNNVCVENHFRIDYLTFSKEICRFCQFLGLYPYFISTDIFRTDCHCWSLSDSKRKFSTIDIILKHDLHMK